MSKLPKQLKPRIYRTAKQANCSPDAIMFVLRNLPQNESTNRETTHINAADLCWRMHDRAMVMFNATARAQMYKWGITSTKDIGHIVFELINEGLITRSDNHQQSEFENVFDFEQEFRALKCRSQYLT